MDQPTRPPEDIGDSRNTAPPPSSQTHASAVKCRCTCRLFPMDQQQRRRVTSKPRAGPVLSRVAQCTWRHSIESAEVKGKSLGGVYNMAGSSLPPCSFSR